MRPDQKNFPRVYLNPGELHLASSPVVIETVLGSCVAVTLFSASSGHAAMCHAMLPSGPCGEFRYVDACLHHMINQLQQRGNSPAQLVAKVFGGADMFSALRNATPTRFPVGMNNLQRVRDVLAEYRIGVKSYETGGLWGRKVVFFTDTGQVYVKRLQSNNEKMTLDLPYLNGQG